MGNLKNFATSLVVTAPVPALSGTTLIVRAADGIVYPATPFSAIAVPPSTLPEAGPNVDNTEKILVTGISGDTLTIVRAQPGTTAKSIAAGWRISNAIFTEDMFNGSVVENEVPGGVINGVNTAFTLASAGRVTNSLKLYINRTRLKGGGNDYTETATGFTMVTAPATGAALIADYRVGGNSDYSVGTNSKQPDEVPAGLIDGVNTLYTTARPYIAGSLQPFVNGARQRNVAHFTETNPALGTFTMSDAPVTGDDFFVNYDFNLNPSSNADTVDGYHGDDLMPIGAGMEYWGDTVPSSNWLFSYGQAISRATYATLFARIGTIHGAGDGTTTFNLPDKRGRATAGKDNMGGSSANRLTNTQVGGLDGDILGASGGTEAHTLTLAQIPNVTGGLGIHGGENGSIFVNRSGAFTFPSGVTAQYKAPSGSTGGSQSALNSIGFDLGGGGGAHNNVQPTITANYIIKVL